MRPRRLLIPLFVLSPLTLASPALGADATVSVVDFAFEAKNVQIDVGEKVTWNFAASGHTTTSTSGQAERWNSGPEVSPIGTSFEKTFTKPGRFTYVCAPHESFMKGTVTVGTDEYRKSYSSFKQSRRGSTVTYRFKLVEAAKLSLSLTGADRRKASRKRLSPGTHSIKLRKLDEGSFRVKAIFTDDFGKKSVARIRTVVR